MTSEYRCIVRAVKFVADGKRYHLKKGQTCTLNADDGRRLCEQRALEAVPAKGKAASPDE